MDSTVSVAIIGLAGIAGGYVRDVYLRCRTDDFERQKVADEREAKRAEAEKTEHDKAEAVETTARAVRQDTVIEVAEGLLSITQDELQQCRQRERLLEADNAALRIGLEQVVPILTAEVRRLRQAARHQAREEDEEA